MRVSSFSPAISLPRGAPGARSRRDPATFSISEGNSPVASIPSSSIKASNSARKVVSLTSKSVSPSADAGIDVPARPSTRQNSGSDSSLTPIIDTKAKAVKVVTTPSRDPVPPVLTGNVGQDAIAMVSADLTARGIDPASFQFSYSEQTVTYPGGSYVNRLINAKVNGQTENYDAALVLKSPQVAAVEMLRLFSSSNNRSA